MTRDMSFKAFEAACVRNGFKPQLGGMWLRDMTTKDVTMYGCVIGPKGIDYRYSIAHAIKKRAEDRALGQRVLRLRKEGKTDEQIQTITGMTQNKVIRVARAAAGQPS